MVEFAARLMQKLRVIQTRPSTGVPPFRLWNVGVKDRFYPNFKTGIFEPNP
jgi:hypothetical protein